MREYRIKHREIIRERARAYNKKYKLLHPEKLKEVKKNYRIKYPDAYKAHIAIRRLRSKILKKECEMCGSNVRLELHHPDYSQPKLTVTLCNLCHNKIPKRVNYEYD